MVLCCFCLIWILGQLCLQYIDNYGWYFHWIYFCLWIFLTFDSLYLWCRLWSSLERCGHQSLPWPVDWRTFWMCLIENQLFWECLNKNQLLWKYLNKNLFWKCLNKNLNLKFFQRSLIYQSIAVSACVFNNS
jgi:hypothetical protein